MYEEIKDILGRQRQATLFSKLAPPLQDDFLRHFPDYELQDVTDFGKEGLANWRAHRQANLAIWRQPPDLSHFSYYNSRSMDLTTTAGVSSAEAWGRYNNGGRQVDFSDNNKVDKILFGGVYALRAFSLDNIYRYWIGVDTQLGASDRTWFRVGLLRRDTVGNADADVFQYSSAGVDTPTWEPLIDSTGATVYQPFNWNEPLKPTFTPVMIELDYKNRRFSKLVWNGQEYGLSAPVSQGTAVADFNNGMIYMHALQNPPSGTIAQQTALIESPFLAFKYGS